MLSSARRRFHSFNVVVERHCVRGPCVAIVDDADVDDFSRTLIYLQSITACGHERGYETISNRTLSQHTHKRLTVTSHCLVHNRRRPWSGMSGKLYYCLSDLLM